MVRWQYTRYLFPMQVDVPVRKTVTSLATDGKECPSMDLRLGFWLVPTWTMDVNYSLNKRVSCSLFAKAFRLSIFWNRYVWQDYFARNTTWRTIHMVLLMSQLCVNNTFVNVLSYFSSIDNETTEFLLQFATSSGLKMSSPIAWRIRERLKTKEAYLVGVRVQSPPLHIQIYEGHGFTRKCVDHLRGR